PVAVLVTCAGVMATSAAAASIATMTADVWERTFAVNALGTFLCVREFLRRYAEQAVPAGRIVTMSSAAAQIGGYRGDAAYIASKAAVIGFTKIAARQAAAAGITVNCVAAGPVATPMFDRAMDEASLPGLLDRIPAGRIGQPAEIAALVAHLAGQDAGFITGATFDVNGGYSMR
ncbi:MAG: SDR family oxidoreductase, partial [Pseudomonadota bacterium]